MKGSTFGGRKFRRSRILSTEVMLTVAVICTYFVYKTVTISLPTEDANSPVKEPSLLPGVQASVRGLGKALPVQRDVLSFNDVRSDVETDSLDFLNLGRWNVTGEIGEPSRNLDKSEDTDRNKKEETAKDTSDNKKGEPKEAVSKQRDSAVDHIAGSESSSNKSIDYGEEGKGISYIDKVHASEPVVSPHNFNYILNPKDFCKDQDLYFITYIHTAAKYRDRRDHIRRTWGNPSLHKAKFKVLFVLGANDDKDMQKAIVQESNKHGDILQEDFVDTYRNLTHKGVAALKWIEKYCSHAKYVLKTDDDTFVNTFTYIRYLQSIDRVGTDTDNMILCAVWNTMVVSRKGKWGVTKEQFADTSYPTYCSGCAFTFTMDVALAIHKISYHVPFFWVDDAYITGVLPKRIGKVKHRNCRSTYEMNSDKLEEKFTGNEWWRYIFSSDIHRFDEAEEVWNKVVELFKPKN